MISHMPHPDLVAYIQQQIQKGMSAQTLRESLMEAGWQERDIENALNDVAAGSHPTAPRALTRHIWRRVLWSGALIALLALLGYVVVR